METKELLIKHLEKKIDELSKLADERFIANDFGETELYVMRLNDYKKTLLELKTTKQ